MQLNNARFFADMKRVKMFIAPLAPQPVFQFASMKFDSAGEFIGLWASNGYAVAQTGGAWADSVTVNTKLLARWLADHPPSVTLERVKDGIWSEKEITFTHESGAKAHFSDLGVLPKMPALDQLTFSAQVDSTSLKRALRESMKQLYSGVYLTFYQDNIWLRLAKGVKVVDKLPIVGKPSRDHDYTFLVNPEFMVWAAQSKTVKLDFYGDKVNVVNGKISEFLIMGMKMQCP